MILGIIVAIIYSGLLIASLVGIIYFIVKRQGEKKQEKKILDRDDY